MRTSMSSLPCLTLQIALLNGDEAAILVQITWAASASPITVYFVSVCVGPVSNLPRDEWSGGPYLA